MKTMGRMIWWAFGGWLLTTSACALLRPTTIHETHDRWGLGCKQSSDYRKILCVAEKRGYCGPPSMVNGECGRLQLLLVGEVGRGWKGPVIVHKAQWPEGDAGKIIIDDRPAISLETAEQIEHDAVFTLLEGRVAQVKPNDSRFDDLSFVVNLEGVKEVAQALAERSIELSQPPSP